MSKIDANETKQALIDLKELCIARDLAYLDPYLYDAISKVANCLIKNTRTAIRLENENIKLNVGER